MKIAWFTPFGVHSAIGRFSAAVTERLAREACIDLWLAEPETEDLLETPLRVVRYPKIPNAGCFLSEYDVVVYNLGDQARNHGPIYEMSQQVRGIVILHDYVMHHFFATYYHERGEFDRFVEILRRRYGAQIDKTHDGWDGSILRLRDTDEVIGYPLFEEAIVGCDAVITHSTFVGESVRRVAGVPVTSIPLAFPANVEGPVLSRAELEVPEDRALVVTVGHANENKRIHVVMQALAADRDLAGSILYVVVGGCGGPFGPKLQELCRELNLGDAVRFTGYASDVVLRSYLSYADVCINLRWPAMEGGSASCAEQMLFGKASIVTDTGVYSELPDNCVRKVRPDHELEDLTRHLRDLVDDPELCQCLGEQSRRYAEANFTPDVYAGRFLDFCSVLARYKPAMSLMDSAGKELRRMGVTSEMAILDTVAREAALLVEGDCNPPILRSDTMISTPASI